jgi:diamine N-acetyltransferase
MASPDVHLREITDDNRAAICQLRVRKRQRRFVASVARSLKAAAASPDDNPWYRAVYHGDEPVGFVMLEWNTPTDRPGAGRYFLGRFLIDQRHQRRGIGREVLRQIIDLARADGATELLTSDQPGKGDPGPFYRRLGFDPTGEIDDGEIVMRLALTQAS